MSRISFRENGEEHNFWQNYTDLMSGFLIVFIITSLVAYGSYKVYVDLYHSRGITENNINDIVVNAELYKKITPIRDKIAISCMLREIHEFSSHTIRHGLYIKNRKRLFCP